MAISKLNKTQYKCLLTKIVITFYIMYSSPKEERVLVYLRFQGMSMSEVIMKGLLMIMMANDIWGWMSQSFPRHLSYSWGKILEKPQPGKLTRLGKEPVHTR